MLATNVAETSLTVPGIRYVIDAGLARVKRYSLRNKVTLLQIEKISQAAANQRAGRCGRVAAGVCVRLYGEDDFAARPRFTDPEILRSSLAAVILRMAALDLGEVEPRFRFSSRRGPRAIADGYQLLQELGAVDARARVDRARARARAAAGRPAHRAHDPRRRARHGCLAEVLVIASALSVPDPRERPLDKQQAADQAHLRFRDERSDFLCLIALWEFFADALAEGLTHRRLVDALPRAVSSRTCACANGATCTRSSPSRCASSGWRWSEALPESIDAARYALDPPRAARRACSATSAARPTRSEHYLGARGIKFFLHPGSGLAKKGPQWVLAAELTETTRLYARCAAKHRAGVGRGGCRRSRAEAPISTRTGTRSAARSSRASG